MTAFYLEEEPKVPEEETPIEEPKIEEPEEELPLQNKSPAQPCVIA